MSNSELANSLDTIIADISKLSLIELFNVNKLLYNKLMDQDSNDLLEEKGVSKRVIDLWNNKLSKLTIEEYAQLPNIIKEKELVTQEDLDHASSIIDYLSAGGGSSDGDSGGNTLCNLVITGIKNNQKLKFIRAIQKILKTKVSDIKAAKKIAVEILDNKTPFIAMENIDQEDEAAKTMVTELGEYAILEFQPIK